MSALISSCLSIGICSKRLGSKSSISLFLRSNILEAQLLLGVPSDMRIEERLKLSLSPRENCEENIPETQDFLIKYDILMHATIFIKNKTKQNTDHLRPKKKRCLFALFQPTQNIGKLGLLFFFFFFLIFNFAFLNKIVIMNFSTCIATVPEVNCVGTEGVCVYPIHVSTSLLSITKIQKTT